MGAATRGVSSGLRFLAVLGIARLSQVPRASLSEGQTLLTSVGFEGGAR
jgi:hypothetical protein